MGFKAGLLVGALVFSATISSSDGLPGEERRLSGVEVTQAAIESGGLSLSEIQRQGLLVFSTPFNGYDGYGDGPASDKTPLELGGRRTLQNNGTFLRVHGLDGQSCLECHSVVSNFSVPAVFGIGGFGGSASNALVSGGEMDVLQADTGFVGRFINPPFVFGTGGIQLLAGEMTTELLALKRLARENEGQDVPLTTKGVDFGTLRFEAGHFDYSRVEGVDDDLIVRPFGRKGEFATVRAFDLLALPFHFGMEPTEVVGEGVDGDGDGVTNEIRPGPISALEVFITTLPPPVESERRARGKYRIRNAPPSPADRGFARFEEFGCADCHRPALETSDSTLTYRLPEVPEDPHANVYLEVDLRRPRGGFNRASDGGPGISVPLFADLKRHDMGPALAENFGSPHDPHFTTARLWGVADTAPYMHDGRALTLASAIMMHGGEAQASRDAFAAARESEQADLLHFLRTLRTPVEQAARHNRRLLHPRAKPRHNEDEDEDED